MKRHNSIIIMGVAGSGKTTIGRLLAEKTGVPFSDADDFHPQSNIEKMASGIPLDDIDRLPWLKILQTVLENESPIVLACSALKSSYRDMLDPEKQHHWVYLKGDKKLISKRLNERSGHFMKDKMLDSQFEALEEPKDALRVAIDGSPQAICEEIIYQLNLL